MIVLDGKELAARVRRELQGAVSAFIAARGISPKLCVLRTGDDAASAIYVRNKAKQCEEVGMRSELVHLLAPTPAEVNAQIDRWNDDTSVHGILVQLPLSPGLNEQAILARIAPHKDVDGLGPYNTGLFNLGAATIVPCTPKGCMRLIHEVLPSLKGQQAVVVGRSNIVGKPMALLLLQADATVTVCHSQTVDLAVHIARADIVVAAVGKPELVRGAWIKEGAVVIDVGINRAGGRIVGDVEFAAASLRARAITPVPGGVGPMTIAMLLENTLLAAQR